jgi:hypothetical protein
MTQTRSVFIRVRLWFINLVIYVGAKALTSVPPRNTLSQADFVVSTHMRD